MIAVTATFAVLKRQISPASIQVLTILTNLADIEPHDAIAPALPTYSEAVRIVTERGLRRSLASDFSNNLALRSTYRCASASSSAPQMKLTRWRPQWPEIEPNPIGGVPWPKR
jgi:hypothetical protein